MIDLDGKVIVDRFCSQDCDAGARSGSGLVRWEARDNRYYAVYKIPEILFERELARLAVTWWEKDRLPLVLINLIWPSYAFPIPRKKT